MLDPAITREFDARRDFSHKSFRSVCYAPFVSMVFDTIGRVRVCCGNFEFTLGNLLQERIDDIWSGERIKKIRDALRNYDLSLGCLVCHSRLTLGIHPLESRDKDQALLINKFENYAVEQESSLWPKHMEFHLSNRCNLECVMCFGEFSSLIRAKRDKKPPFPDAYGDQFFTDLRKYLPHLEQAQFLGGEPFIIPGMYRIWDMMIEDRATPVCHITTNGTVWGEKVERILESLPVNVNVSLDGVTKEVFESIRINAKFERVVGNFRRIRDTCARRGQYVGLNLTLQQGNWHNVVDYLLFAEDEGVQAQISTAYSPTDISLYALPLDQLRHIAQHVERQAALAAPKLRRNRSVLEVHLQELRSMITPEGQATAAEMLRDIDLSAFGKLSDSV